MKISQMLLREDFYDINDKTLSEYFKDADDSSWLYIYPHLNAIITASPSKKVKEYLLSEYSVKGSPLKAFLVRCYVYACLFTRGKLATRKIKIKNTMTDDMLIYPCNKKYRVFDFASGSVDVIAKSGFPKNDLMREIEFRTHNKEEFIPEIIKFDKTGYSEKIIDGIPLARLSHGFEEYRKRALETLESYSGKQGHTKSVLSKEYACELLNIIKDFVTKTTKNVDKELLLDVSQGFVDLVSENATLKIMLSHGDLQPGNIWVEKTGKMYIIDWESWGIRSEWYDMAALYGNLRNGGIEQYVTNCGSKEESSIVCLEDIIFKLNELNNLPFNYGENEFESYLKKVSSFQKG